MFNTKAINNTTQFILQVPISTSVNDLTTNYFSMRNFKHAEIDVIVGAVSAVGNIKMLQAKDVAGASSKELIINDGQVYESDPTALAGGPGDEAGDASLWPLSTLTLPGAAGSLVDISASTSYKLEIRNDELDQDNEFDCLAVEIDGTNTSALICIKVTLHGGRFQGDPNDRNTVPSPLVNQEATVTA